MLYQDLNLISGKHKRDFSYIDQIVDGIYAIFSNRKNNKKFFRIYTI